MPDTAFFGTGAFGADRPPGADAARRSRTRPPSGAARVLLTRSFEDCAAWAAQLEGRGIVPIVLPCITAELLETPGLAAKVADGARNADWLVFTSRRGVEAFAQLVAQQAAAGRPVGDDGSSPTMSGRIAGPAQQAADDHRIAAVGPATGDAAKALLGRVDVIGDDGTAVGLAAALVRELVRAEGNAGRGQDGPRLLLVLAENARDALERGLRNAGIEPERVNVYRTVPAPPRADKRPLAELGADAVFLASPSAVTGFVNQVDVDESARLVTIGPTTTDAARALGLRVAAEAREASLEGLLEAMQRPAQGPMQ